MKSSHIKSVKKLFFLQFQVLLAMHANVEDRGIKGECTPLMEAASAGHLDIVRLLVAHGADVNAQSTSGRMILLNLLHHSFLTHEL